MNTSECQSEFKSSRKRLINKFHFMSTRETELHILAFYTIIMPGLKYHQVQYRHGSTASYFSVYNTPFLLFAYQWHT